MKTMNGCVSASLTILVAAALQAAEFEVGGPLAGLTLPASKQNTGSGPEVELYPGSVEHWRAYYMKYLPTRSFFDQQSQLKRWTAPALPGATPKQAETYASPVYQQPKNGDAWNTGKTLAPVPVIRCRAGSPVIALDLGTLDAGMYAVRVIGAVETAKLRRFREPLFLRMTVNDGLAGETNRYRIRTGYVDEFYSVGDFYFHAPEKRAYRAELAVDQGTAIDLLVQSITLDDVLAGATRRAIKTQRTLTSDEEVEALRQQTLLAEPKLAEQVAKFPTLSPEERLARDEALWNWYPPLNTPAAWLDLNWSPAEVGSADRTAAQIEEAFGKWEAAGGRETMNNDSFGFTRDPKLQGAFIVNKKLGLEYTMADLRAHKPLPDPYPFKDEGAGLCFPDPKDPAKGRLLVPIAYEVGRRIRASTFPARNDIRIWTATGNRDAAWDGAIKLVRSSYLRPSWDAGNFLNNVTCIPQSQGRDSFCRQRADSAMFFSHYACYPEASRDYDMLFPFIQGNEALAKSISRFIPWVRTSRDVIELLDVYLVQMTAKRILRYHYYTIPTVITELATILGDPTVTNPWMEWQFSRTHIYPLPPAGIQDLMITGCDREGAQYIGSTYYAQGEGGIRINEPIARYLKTGGNPRFNMADPALYPKPLAQCRWQLNTIVGGADFARIGDVCGPDKAPYATMREELATACRAGWEWSAQPSFAWVLKNLVGRKRETDAEWAQVEAAAATVKRAPWLDLPSRHVENWFTALESGLAHDDYRFRRAAYVRTGVGYGHSHADTLDLQFMAHGMPMTIDGGQRSGYSKPNDRFSRTHNTVEVNGGGNDEYGLASYAWPSALSDAPGARYLQAVAPPPPGATLYRRQVALIDVDEGQGSEPLSAALQKPRATLKPGVVTANSYIFDVFRVSGGTLHSYGFHGPVNDDFLWNAKNAVPVADEKEGRGTETDGNFLSIFSATPESKQAGDCPETFEATWRALRVDPAGDPKTGIGSENQMLGANFDKAAPRKFTRLTLHEASGMRALKGDVGTTTQSPVQYRFTHAMLQRRAGAGNLESAFAAIVEPYAGEPLILAQQALPVSGNETDALRAVAIQLQLKGGRTDVCFADGRPDRIREFRIANGLSRIAGEFAFYSADSNGFRQAALTGGTLLEVPGIALRTDRRDYTATITNVDYRTKSFWTDKPLNPASAGRVFEIGAPGCPTAYTIHKIDGTRVWVTGGADFYRAGVVRVTSESNEVQGTLPLPVGRTQVRGLTASNDQLTHFWRLENATDGNVFTVTGAVAAADFAPSNAIRLWEYGVGDTVRLSAFVNIRRVTPGEYEVQGDVDAEITIAGQTRHVSPGSGNMKIAAP